MFFHPGDYLIVTRIILRTKLSWEWVQSVFQGQICAGVKVRSFQIHHVLIWTAKQNPNVIFDPDPQSTCVNIPTQWCRWQDVVLSSVLCFNGVKGEFHVLFWGLDLVHISTFFFGLISYSFKNTFAANSRWVCKIIVFFLSLIMRQMLDYDAHDGRQLCKPRLLLFVWYFALVTIFFFF